MDYLEEATKEIEAFRFNNLTAREVALIITEKALERIRELESINEAHRVMNGELRKLVSGKEDIEAQVKAEMLADHSD
jgi:hypothetical protein